MPPINIGNNIDQESVTKSVKSRNPKSLVTQDHQARIKGENVFGSIDDDVYHSSLENSVENNSNSLDFEQAFKYTPN